ncbi:cytochrome b/b6 domain-containing protein [Rhodopila sp.]|uniref:cytochrome b/b6 domain-containing protein n=1 Tax=Rhodopila sp. TaxID=2480087 RepID=UPI002BEDDB61|nr:cytochrome b/b6 domain-containing protein [Rhodopila sp.]HVZ08581.1 cytochrome b/b6 domain-containing protein [Rhodopila sp.]
MRPITVWDLPTRLFHWILVVLIGLAWWTERSNHMDWHMLVGYAVLALLIFRVIWGFVGSDTARFSGFVRSPLAALRHLSRLARREPDTEVGHNAAGGWMVLLMLALIGVQAGTGLFANDDIMTEGPLMHLVGKDRSDWLTHIHGLNFTLIQAVVVLHVLAILVYLVLKRQNLLRPMITGTKAMPAGMAPPRLRSPLLALATLVVAAGIVAWIVRL